MAEDPRCLHVLSTEADDLGTKDCSSARRSRLSRSTSGPFEFAWKSHDQDARLRRVSPAELLFYCYLIRRQLTSIFYDSLCS
jgi:hypothetical protein